MFVVSCPLPPSTSFLHIKFLTIFQICQTLLDETRPVTISPLPAPLPYLRPAHLDPQLSSLTLDGLPCTVYMSAPDHKVNSSLAGTMHPQTVLCTLREKKVISCQEFKGFALKQSLRPSVLLSQSSHCSSKRSSVNRQPNVRH